MIPISHRDKKKLLQFCFILFVFFLFWVWARFIDEPPVESVVHYRLDVSFEVDGKKVTGSGVQKLVVQSLAGNPFSQKASWDLAGEAVVVELPDRPAVFVLMASTDENGNFIGFGGDGGYRFLFSDACRLKERRGDRNWDDYVRFVGEISGTCNISKEHLPLMVFFRDEADSTSVERVFPDNPEKTLGPGVRFIGASLTVTDAPMTTGINRRLIWMAPENPASRLDPDYKGSLNPTLPESLMHEHFRRTQ